MSELISVVVPVYKVEEYLSRCVDSILGQTYCNIEVILVNDGSPDRCAEMCDEYSYKDPRVKVIHKKNGGLSDARNAGIEKAKGDYISFVDSDDWVHCEYIERLYRLLRSKGADIAVCNFMRTSKEDIEINLNGEDVFEFSNIEALQQYSDRLYVPMVVSWGKLYNKQLFEDVRFPVGRIHEDEFTTHKLIFKARKIVFTTLPLLYYWQREDSIMGSGFKLKNKLDAIDALLERSVFFESIGLNDLRDATNKKVFFMYRSILKYLRQERMSKIDRKYHQYFFVLKERLREGNYKFKFKVFYEAYYIAPSLADVFYDCYFAVRGFFTTSRQ